MATRISTVVQDLKNLEKEQEKKLKEKQNNVINSLKELKVSLEKDLLTKRDTFSSIKNEAVKNLQQEVEKESQKYNKEHDTKIQELETLFKDNFDIAKEKAIKTIFTI